MSRGPIEIYDEDGVLRLKGTSNPAIGGGAAAVAAAVSNSGAQAGVANGDALTFDTTLSDPDGFFDGVDTLTVPVGKGGVYLIVAGASSIIGDLADAGPFVEVQIATSPANQGGTLDPLAAVPNGYFDGNAVFVVALADGDTVQLKTNWTGAALTSAVSTAFLGLTKIG